MSLKRYVAQLNEHTCTLVTLCIRLNLKGEV